MFILTSMLVALAMVLWMMFVPLAHAADQPAGVSASSMSTVELGLAAAGAVEDTLKACLSRIPKEASDGQRMIAEQGCKRDEGDRKVSQTNPYRISP
jgi:hypothetical protein